MNSFCKLIKKYNLIGKLSEELCWEIVQQFTSERPMNCFGELPNKFLLEGFSNVFISEGCPQLKQIFLFEEDFHTWHRHV